MPTAKVASAKQVVRRLHGINLVVGLLVLLAIGHFCCCVVYCMANYPDGYSLSEHFLSDLGSLKTSEGALNPNAALFNRGLVILGFSLILFFGVISWSMQKIQLLVGVSGVLSGLGLMGIGLTPFDVYYLEHHLALGLWLIPMVVLAVSFVIGLWWTEKKALIAVVVTFVTLLLGFAIAGYVFNQQRTGHVIFQKWVALFSVIWFLTILVSVSYSTYYYAVSARLQKIHRQADDYMRVLRKGHRKPAQRRPRQ